MAKAKPISDSEIISVITHLRIKKIELSHSNKIIVAEAELSENM